MTINTINNNNTNNIVVWQDLPNEIWMKIFLELGPNSALYCVSHFFYLLKQDKTLWASACKKFSYFIIPESDDYRFYTFLFQKIQSCYSNALNGRFEMKIDRRVKEEKILSLRIYYNAICVQYKNKHIEIFNALDNSSECYYTNALAVGIVAHLNIIHTYLSRFDKDHKKGNNDNAARWLNKLQNSISEIKDEKCPFSKKLREIFYSNDEDFKLSQIYKENATEFQRKIEELKPYSIEYPCDGYVRGFSASNNYFANYYSGVDMFDIRARKTGERAFCFFSYADQMEWINETLLYATNNELYKMTLYKVDIEKQESIQLHQFDIGTKNYVLDNKCLLIKLNDQMAFANVGDQSLVCDVTENTLTFLQLNLPNLKKNVSYDPIENNLYILGKDIENTAITSYVYEINLSNFLLNKIPLSRDYDCCHFKHHFLWLFSQTGTLTALAKDKTYQYSIRDFSKPYLKSYNLPTCTWVNEKLFFSLYNSTLYTFDFGAIRQNILLDIASKYKQYNSENYSLDFLNQREKTLEKQDRTAIEFSASFLVSSKGVKSSDPQLRAQAIEFYLEHEELSTVEGRENFSKQLLEKRPKKKLRTK